MTVEEMKNVVITEVPFGELTKNTGICEFYQDRNLSIGISFEDNDDGNECYIYITCLLTVSISISIILQTKKNS